MTTKYIFYTPQEKKEGFKRQKYKNENIYKSKALKLEGRINEH